MYFVDMRQMNETLDFFDETLKIVKEQHFATSLEYLALERITHVLIEAIIDTGNMMIDGFIMRDPGSYLDIVHILADENVLPEEDIKVYEDIVSIRKKLVQDYKKMDHQELQTLLAENLPVLLQFTTHIRSYLASEMGIANTFTNIN
ncbi:DUF86 domain-containing protein [Gracilibacillus caseinilyticus]|uniref:DUF86 domain-containing protein n=1 Tax=Gracilibacillus caseinilyticus TaxID=2932256 RepID=A0ABY4EUR7_9BACI|nr:DUF86 domain-containing protein [Gracilibacillus caseinilyticus]UOQ48159.1 DUF86 domain-containing protein [Gracilibacillus caseinilyticus]